MEQPSTGEQAFELRYAFSIGMRSERPLVAQPLLGFDLLEFGTRTFYRLAILKDANGCLARREMSEVVALAGSLTCFEFYKT